jgi:hypothetical protein
MTIVILLPGRTHAKSPLTSEERATLAAAPGRAATKGESGSQAYRARRKGRLPDGYPATGWHQPWAGVSRWSGRMGAPGAGDGNRTRTISLGSFVIRALGPPDQQVRMSVRMVGSRAGAVAVPGGRAWGLSSAGFPVGCATPVTVARSLRFQPPPVDPGMRFSRTRLTDALHRRCSAGTRQARLGLGATTMPLREIRPRAPGDR